MNRSQVSWVFVTATSLILGTGCATPHTVMNEIRTGHWNAELMSPGGPLPFGLEIAENEGTYEAAIFNGEERIPIPIVTSEGEQIVLDMPHYDSEIRAVVKSDHEIEGRWRKRRGKNLWAHMEFRAELASTAPAAVDASAYVGRWSVKFASDDDPAICEFQQPKPGVVRGTFLTTTGDYRFLAGRVTDGKLEMSCFDGAHAFLFHAELQSNGSLRGDFWSGDAWHETWEATPNPTAELPDAFAQTTWEANVPLSSLSFPDLSGKLWSLDDPRFAGRAKLLHVFGSWCPNCHDAAIYLGELHRKYASEGLSIIGLAFEITGDFARDARQVRLHIERHETPYPVLIVGLADKAKATEQFGALDRIRSYPTTIFVDAQDRVREIHTGFTGPATGASYQQLRQSFERKIERLLSE